MFAKLAIKFFTVATMAALVAADGGIQNSCNTGEVQCCNSLQQANSPQYSGFLALLGLSAADITGQLGVHCSPISAIAVGGGSSCTTQPVCCSNNNFNGVLAVGCSPVNVS